MALWSLLLLQSATPLIGDTGWSVREDRGTCIALGSDGENDGIVLANTPWSPKLSIIVPADKGSPAAPRVRLVLLPQNQTADATAHTSPRKDGSRMLIVDTFVEDRWAGATGLQITLDKRQVIDVQRLGDAKDRLTACGDAIVRRHGLDPAQRRPSKDISDAMRAGAVKLFGYDGYPREALKRNQKGPVTVAVQIAADGQITACQIVATSGGKELDDGTCRIFLDRVKLRPAANGKDGWDAVKVTWVRY